MFVFQNVSFIIESSSLPQILFIGISKHISRFIPVRPAKWLFHSRMTNPSSGLKDFIYHKYSYVRPSFAELLYNSSILRAIVHRTSSRKLIPASVMVVLASSVMVVADDPTGHFFSHSFRYVAYKYMRSSHLESCPLQAAIWVRVLHCRDANRC